eukprot:gene6049-biopygen5945
MRRVSCAGGAAGAAPWRLCGGAQSRSSIAEPGDWGYGHGTGGFVYGGGKNSFGIGGDVNGPLAREGATWNPLRRRTVVIIGAGHSGVTTAHYLAEAGCDVHVVDSREEGQGYFVE